MKQTHDVGRVREKKRGVVRPADKNDAVALKGFSVGKYLGSTNESNYEPVNRGTAGGVFVADLP